jgi:hypothetical protein
MRCWGELGHAIHELKRSSGARWEIERGLEWYFLYFGGVVCCCDVLSNKSVSYIVDELLNDFELQIHPRYHHTMPQQAVTVHGLQSKDIREKITLLIDNLVNIKDETGEFLMPLADGRIIDTKGWRDWEYDCTYVVSRIES